MKYDQIGVRYEWAGGECPVDGGFYIQVNFRRGNHYVDYADSFSWSHYNDDTDIIAFEIVEFAK